MSKWTARQKSNGDWEIEEAPEITPEGIVIGVISIIICFIIFAGLLITNNFMTDVREKTAQKKHEAQMAISASIWDLDVIESDAIYGSNTKYDSDGNAYSGEFREFCAWSYPGEVFEPHIIVDVNEKNEYKRFTGTIFTRPEQKEKLSITFKIYADGKCIYDSGKMHASTKAIDINLDIEGVNQLKFVASTADNDSYCNPAVILVNATVHAE